MAHSVVLATAATISRLSIAFNERYQSPWWAQGRITEEFLHWVLRLQAEIDRTVGIEGTRFINLVASVLQLTEVMFS